MTSLVTLRIQQSRCTHTYSKGWIKGGTRLNGVLTLPNILLNMCKNKEIHFSTKVFNRPKPLHHTTKTIAQNFPTPM